MAFIPPNGPLEVVFSFDTTGSMYGCLEQVRGRIKDMIQRLQSDIPGIRTAVIAHGDYCDAKIYITKWTDFTTNVAELCDFVTNVERTSGGDGPECYELVLNQTRNKLSWTPGSRRVLVLIGDDEPHGTDYAANVDKIDWKHETQQLAMMGVTVYPVQCGNGGVNATAFYKTLAAVTAGKHLKLEDFNNLFDVLMAVCYREGNDMALLTSYEKEVRARCGAATSSKDIDALFASLRNEDACDSSTSSDVPTSTTTTVTGTMKTSVVKTKTPKVKSLMTKTPLKSPMRRKSTARGMASIKKTSVLDMYRQDRLPLLKRENVPETNFGLRTLVWSPWTLVMSSDVPEGSETNWTKRRSMPGYRLKCIKPNTSLHNKDRKVLFEVSIQTPGSGKQRYTVYSSFSTKCLHNTRWESSLLRRVRDQLNKLISNGCRMFLRYHLMSSRENLSSLRSSLKRYDYAWKVIRNVRREPRPAMKGSHHISMDLS